MRNLILPFCMLFASCAASSNDRVLNPSQLNKNLEIYDGQTVLVEGFLVVQIGKSSSLWDSKKRYSQDNDLDHCITLRNSDVLLDVLSEINNTKVKLSGKFKKDIVGNAINLNVCNSSGVEITSLAE